jgi:hypothetical protein
MRPPNVIAFPNNPEPSDFEIRKRRALDILAEMRAEGDRERREQMRAAGPQGRAIDRATKRLAKAAKELESAIDAIRIVAGLPSL